MPRFEIITPEDGPQSPIIVDTERNISILGLDDRIVDGKVHITPVINDPEMALAICNFLNQLGEYK